MDDRIVKVLDEAKKDKNLLCAFFIGKYKIDLGDIDLLFIYDDNREFEREVDFKYNLKFDISFISYNDIIRMLNENDSLWKDILSKVDLIYKKDSNLSDKIIDRIKNIDFYIHLDKIEIDYIRFKLYEYYTIMNSKKYFDYEKKFLLNNYLKESIEFYFTLNKIHKPNSKKILKKLEEIDSSVYSVVKNILIENDIKIKIELLNELFNIMLKDYGGYLKVWKKGNYPINR